MSSKVRLCARTSIWEPEFSVRTRLRCPGIQAHFTGFLQVASPLPQLPEELMVAVRALRKRPRGSPVEADNGPNKRTRAAR
eukprot:3390696-Prymnesium_polylepis.1